MKKKILILFLVPFIIPTIGKAQGIGRVTYLYSRKIIDSLTSPNLNGRGYVNDGDKKAADYIRNEFQNAALQSFNNDYFQPFSFPVNTYPSDISFSCSFRSKGKTIVFKGIPGQNFLVYPSSPSINTPFKTIVFDSSYASSEAAFKQFGKKIKSKTDFVIVDDRGVTNKSKLAYFKKVKEGYFEGNIIELVPKLTWTVSQTITKYTRIQVLADSFAYTSKGKGNVLIESRFIPKYQTQNIIGYIKGTQQSDSFIVFSAHYDHLGQLGKNVYFPGANDNASGCAMLLNLINYYSMPGHRPKYSIAFIAFAGEEAGLLGSHYYTEHPLFPLKNISFMINLDLVGTGDDGITVVNGSVYQKEFDELVNINAKKDYLKEIKIRGKAANSDHYYFSEKGVKAFFIYTMGGIKAYHDIYDIAKTLPLTEFEDLYWLIIDFVDTLQLKAS